MSRTTAALVQALLQGDYKPGVDLAPHLDTASALVDRVDSAAKAGGAQMPDSLLELIERWCAAHAYAMVDQPFASKSSEGASGSFQGQTGKYFEATKYGQMAVSLDYTGTLEGGEPTGGSSGGGAAVPEAWWLGA